MKTKPSKTGQDYQAPHLEQQEQYALKTGVSLPIGTTGIDNPLEMNDFMEGANQ